MTHIKISIPTKIRNIKLVDPDNQDYIDFIDNIKLKAYHIRKPNQRKFADLISFPIEKTVRYWIQQSGLAINERIISYEKLNSDSVYQKNFNELDFIFLFKEKYWIGEVKVGSSLKAKRKASNQLTNAKTILNQCQLNTELLMLHVNLDSEIDTIEFNDDFRIILNDLCEDEQHPFHYLNIDAHGIFQYGVKSGLVEDKELLANALSEADQIKLNRAERQSLIQNDVPREKWPEHLKENGILEDNEQHVISFGESSHENLLAQKLKDALNHKDS